MMTVTQMVAARVRLTCDWMKADAGEAENGMAVTVS